MANSECPFHKLGDPILVARMNREPRPLGKNSCTYYGAHERGQAMSSLLYLAPTLNNAIREIRHAACTQGYLGAVWQSAINNLITEQLNTDFATNNDFDTLNGATRYGEKITLDTYLPAGLLYLINEGGLIGPMGGLVNDIARNFTMENIENPKFGGIRFENESITCPAKHVVLETISVALWANIYLSRLEIPVESGYITCTKPSKTNSFGYSWKSREEIIAEYEGIREQYPQAGI